MEPDSIVVGGLLTLSVLSFVGGVFGYVLSAVSNYGEIKLAKSLRDLAHKEAGKLSRIIGRQRLTIAKLKAKLEASQPKLTNEEKRKRYEITRGSARPNLPH